MNALNIEIATQIADILKAHTKGQVVLPSDPDYHDTRAVWNGMIDRAISCFGRSQNLSKQSGEIKAAEDIGNTYLSLENFQQAHNHFIEALRTIAQIELPSLKLQVLGSIARFMIETGDIETGIQYMSFAYNHALTENEICETAEITITQYRESVSPTIYAIVTNKGQEVLLQEAINELYEVFPFYTWDKNTIPAKMATPQRLIEPLTDRELEVLHLLAQGFSNTEIADQLIITVGTVKTHNHNIFGKLGIKNRVQAIRKAQEIKLL